MRTYIRYEMNIWALPKSTELRLVLLTLEQQVGLGRLVLDNTDNQNRQALHINDLDLPGLSAYLYTYGQQEHHYGLELHYPVELDGSLPPYQPLEGLNLEQTVELIQMHFEL